MEAPRQRQEEIFARALTLPAGPTRDAYLDSACTGDEELRRNLAGLLAAHEEAGTFMQVPAGPALDMSGGDRDSVWLATGGRAGDRIGRYHLIEKIGDGGFGEVWMADQEEPLRRTLVADGQSEFYSAAFSPDGGAAFSPDGRMLAIRKSAGEVQLLDPENGWEWATLPGKQAKLLCFSPAGDQLVVGEEGRTVSVWDLRSLRTELAKLNLDWNRPPYSAPAAAASPPMRIEVRAP